MLIYRGHEQLTPIYVNVMSLEQAKENDRIRSPNIYNTFSNIANCFWKGVIMSNLSNGHVGYHQCFYLPVVSLCRKSNLRNGHVAMLNLVLNTQSYELVSKSKSDYSLKQKRGSVQLQAYSVHHPLLEQAAPKIKRTKYKQPYWSYPHYSSIDKPVADDIFSIR